MELKTTLAHADVVAAIASAFPGHGVTISDAASEAADFTVAFDDPSVTEAQLASAITAYSSAAAQLQRSKQVLFGQVDQLTASKLAAWSYVGRACPIVDSLKLGSREALEWLQQAGSGQVSWDFGSGAVVQMAAADLMAFISAREGYEQGVRAYAGSLVVAITAASSAKALAALDLTSGWPSPQA